MLRAPHESSPQQDVEFARTKDVVTYRCGMNLLDLSPVSLGSVTGHRLPGLSSCVNGGWVHGEDALQHCRLDPQSTVLDVWESLSLDPLPQSGNMRHRADLAVAQLRDLNLDTEAQWCVSVPAHWTKPVLQLFLGVAAECDLSIQGLFPRALAVAASSDVEADTCTVLEWDWKTLRVVEVVGTSEEWCLSKVELLQEGGVMPFFRRESRIAAALMLERHRVDPLYSGKTEQHLFTSWWDWHFGSAHGWVAESGSVNMDLSEASEVLQDAHGSVLQNHGLENRPVVTAPTALSQLAGCSDWQSERIDASLALGGLNLPAEKGPVWREQLGRIRSSSVEKAAATHVVIDGVAERIPEGMRARPGERVNLKDGRVGLAILVPGD